MIRYTDDDWALLSTFADGELDPVRSAAVEARLRADPDLRRELGRLRDLKRELVQLRPPQLMGASPSPVAVPARRRPVAVAAAALILVVLFGAASMLWPSEQPDVLAGAAALHERFSQATYVVDEGYVSRIVSSGHDLEFRAPDLTASRLYLVDVVTSPADGTDAIAMHYRGMSGCRLTVAAFPGTGDVLETTEIVGLARTWSYGGFDFAVIAKGMDGERFASVAAYVEAAIADGMQRHDDLQVAMANDYDAAAPCA